MALLNSPIDGSPMQQIKRFGIELDVCPTTGGVWLDKGELEKLINFIKQSAQEDAQEDVSYSARARQANLDNRESYYRSNTDRKYSDDDYYRKGHYKKKSGLSKVMELFDF
jgi:hypothetical protein